MDASIGISNNPLIKKKITKNSINRNNYNNMPSNNIDKKERISENLKNYINENENISNKNISKNKIITKNKQQQASFSKNADNFFTKSLNKINNCDNGANITNNGLIIENITVNKSNIKKDDNSNNNYFIYKKELINSNTNSNNNNNKNFKLKNYVHKIDTNNNHNHNHNNSSKNLHSIRQDSSKRRISIFNDNNNNKTNITNSINKNNGKDNIIIHENYLNESTKTFSNIYKLYYGNNNNKGNKNYSNTSSSKINSSIRSFKSKNKSNKATESKNTNNNHNHNYNKYLYTNNNNNNNNNVMKLLKPHLTIDMKSSSPPIITQKFSNNNNDKNELSETSSSNYYVEKKINVNLSRDIVGSGLNTSNSHKQMLTNNQANENGGKKNDSSNNNNNINKQKSNLSISIGQYTNLISTPTTANDCYCSNKNVSYSIKSISGSSDNKKNSNSPNEDYITFAPNNNNNNNNINVSNNHAYEKNLLINQVKNNNTIIYQKKDEPYSPFGQKKYTIINERINNKLRNKFSQNISINNANINNKYRNDNFLDEYNYITNSDDNNSNNNNKDNDLYYKSSIGDDNDNDNDLIKNNFSEEDITSPSHSNQNNKHNKYKSSAFHKSFAYVILPNENKKNRNNKNNKNIAINNETEKKNSLLKEENKINNDKRIKQNNNLNSPFLNKKNLNGYHHQLTQSFISSYNCNNSNLKNKKIPPKTKTEVHFINDNLSCKNININLAKTIPNKPSFIYNKARSIVNLEEQNINNRNNKNNKKNKNYKNNTIYHKSNPNKNNNINNKGKEEDKNKENNIDNDDDDSYEYQYDLCVNNIHDFDNNKSERETENENECNDNNSKINKTISSNDITHKNKFINTNIQINPHNINQNRSPQQVYINPTKNKSKDKSFFFAKESRKRTKTNDFSDNKSHFIEDIKKIMTDKNNNNINNNNIENAHSVYQGNEVSDDRSDFKTPSSFIEDSNNKFYDKNKINISNININNSNILDIIQKNFEISSATDETMTMIPELYNELFLKKKYSQLNLNQYLNITNKLREKQAIKYSYIYKYYCKHFTIPHIDKCYFSKKLIMPAKPESKIIKMPLIDKKCFYNKNNKIIVINNNINSINIHKESFGDNDCFDLLKHIRNKSAINRKNNINILPPIIITELKINEKNISFTETNYNNCNSNSKNNNIQKTNLSIKEGQIKVKVHDAFFNEHLKKESKRNSLKNNDKEILEMTFGREENLLVGKNISNSSQIDLNSLTLGGDSIGLINSITNTNNINHSIHIKDIETAPINNLKTKNISEINNTDKDKINRQDSEDYEDNQNDDIQINMDDDNDDSNDLIENNNNNQKDKDNADKVFNILNNKEENGKDNRITIGKEILGDSGIIPSLDNSNNNINNNPTSNVEKGLQLLLNIQTRRKSFNNIHYINKNKRNERNDRININIDDNENKRIRNESYLERRKNISLGAEKLNSLLSGQRKTNTYIIKPNKDSELNLRRFESQKIALENLEKILNKQNTKRSESSNVKNIQFSSSSLTSKPNFEKYKRIFNLEPIQKLEQLIEKKFEAKNINEILEIKSKTFIPKNKNDNESLILQTPKFKEEMEGKNNSQKNIHKYSYEEIINFNKNNILLCIKDNLLPIEVINHCKELLIYTDDNKNKISINKNDNSKNDNWNRASNDIFLHPISNNKEKEKDQNQTIEKWSRLDLTKEIEQAEKYIQELNIKMSKDNYKFQIIEILNTITVDNYNDVLKKITTLIFICCLKNEKTNITEILINNQNIFIKIIFDKATSEKGYVILYAKLCNDLYNKSIQIINDYEEDINIKNILLNGDNLKSILINESRQRLNIKDTPSNKKEDDDDDEIFQMKKKFIGNINFISELINVNLVSQTIGFEFLNELYNRYNDSANQNNKFLYLEGVITLLNKFGKIVFERQNEKHILDLNNFINDNIKKLLCPPSSPLIPIPNFIKYKIINLIEKQKNNWNDSLYEKSINVKGKNNDFIIDSNGDKNKEETDNNKKDNLIQIEIENINEIKDSSPSNEKQKDYSLVENEEDEKDNMSESITIKTIPSRKPKKKKHLSMDFTFKNPQKIFQYIQNLYKANDDENGYKKFNYCITHNKKKKHNIRLIKNNPEDNEQKLINEIKADIENYSSVLASHNILSTNDLLQLEEINEEYNWIICDKLITKEKIELNEIIRLYIEICIDYITEQNKIFSANQYIKNIIDYYSIDLPKYKIEIIHNKMIDLFLNIDNLCIDNYYMYEIVGFLLYVLISNKLFYIKDFNYFFDKESETIVVLSKVIRYCVIAFDKNKKRFFNDVKHTKIFVNNEIFEQYVVEPLNKEFGLIFSSSAN